MNVSSMYLSHIDGFSDVDHNAISSKYSMCVLANTSDVEILLDHVNSIRPSIQFTMEKEEDNKIPFHDVLVTRTEKDSGHLCTVSHLHRTVPQFQLPSSIYGKERNSPLLATSSKNH